MGEDQGAKEKEEVAVPARIKKPMFLFRRLVGICKLGSGSSRVFAIKANKVGVVNTPEEQPSNPHALNPSFLAINPCLVKESRRKAGESGFALIKELPEGILGSTSVGEGIDWESEDVEEAATKLQAGFFGWKARQALAELERQEKDDEGDGN